MRLVVVKKAYDRTELGEWSHNAPYPTEEGALDPIRSYRVGRALISQRTPSARELNEHPEVARIRQEMTEVTDERRHLSLQQSKLGDSSADYDYYKDLSAKMDKLSDKYDELDALDNLTRNRISKAHWDKHQEDYKQGVRNVLPHYYPSMLFQHEPHSTVLKAIINSGKFKNQYEIMAEKGEKFVRDKGRDATENKWHSGLTHESPFADRPVYARLERVPRIYHDGRQFTEIVHPSQRGSLSYAGNHEMILHPHDVLSNSTMSAGDSFIDHYTPHPVFDPHESTFIGANKYQDALKSLTDDYEVPLELQIHNGLYFPKHVAGIVFRGMVPHRDVTDHLDKTGVKWAFNPVNYKTDHRAMFYDKLKDIHDLTPLLIKYAPDSAPHLKKQLDDTTNELQDEVHKNLAKFDYPYYTDDKQMHDMSDKLDGRKRLNAEITNSSYLPTVGETAWREMRDQGFPSILGRRVGE